MFIGTSLALTRNVSVGGEGDTSIQSIIPSAIYDVDATQLASYNGTDTHWRNLVPTPADGAAKADYDFMLGTTSGADTDDPTFNGTAGSQAAYWTFSDTADCFQLPANTTLTANLHQAASTQDWSLAFFYKTGVADLSQLELAATRISSAGIRLRQDAFSSSPEINFFQQNSGGTASGNSGTTYVTLSSETFVVITFDASTGEMKFYVDGAAVVTTTVTYAAGTTAANQALKLFNLMPSDYRVYAASAYNTVISASDVTSLKSFMETRHGRTY